MKVTFNRKFTKGYLLNEYNKNIVNTESVNHQGVVIGKVVSRSNKYIDILLTHDIRLHDGLRVNSKEVYGIYLTSMYVNSNSVKVAKANQTVRIFIENNSLVGDEVVKTTDKLLEEQVIESIKNNQFKHHINLSISMFVGKNITLTGTLGKKKISVSGSILEYSDKCLDENRIKDQLSKLNNTVFKVNKIDIYSDNSSFVRISELNALRRELVEKLNKYILSSYKYNTLPYTLNNKRVNYDNKVEIECVTSNNEQTNVCKEFGINNIYDINNYAPRITDLKNNEQMVHNLGHIDCSKVISPYFNIINKYALDVIKDFGASKCYLSTEMTLDDIKDLDLNNYDFPTGVVAYGNIDLMVSKHCIVGCYKNANNKHCNSCLTNSYYIKDEYNNKFDLILEKNNDCTMRILSYKKINMLNSIDILLNLGIKKFLLIFTTESKEEIKEILKKYYNKLKVD